MTLVDSAPPQAWVDQASSVRYAHVGPLVLESGYRIPDVRLAYETWGTLNGDASNAVLVEHALTGDSHVARGRVPLGASASEQRAARADGWWEGIVGPGAAIDTNRYFVVCANILGGCHGSTGPSSDAPRDVDVTGAPWGSRFPRVTVRDTVNAEAAMADTLGIARWRLVVGGSMGGARALEWAIMYPHRVAACGVIAASATASAEVLGWGHAQSVAIRQDPLFCGGDYYHGPSPAAGLGLARRIAHMTYRCASELDGRFGCQAQPHEEIDATHTQRRGQYKIESYLDHKAAQLSERFDANSYLSINETLMSHDVTRGRGSLREALAVTDCEWFVAAVDSDRLFLPTESEALVRALPGDQRMHLIRSRCGHDGFLTETSQVGSMLGSAVLGDRR